MTPAPTRQITADPARQLAAQVVLAVEQQEAYSNLLLPRLLRERKLAPTDAAFATELTYGSLRWQGVLDAVIASAAGREVSALEPGVRAALRLGAYQLLHTRVPPHAAVSTTVDLTKVIAGHRPAGLVNAVMRKVSQRDWTQWVAALAPADPVGAVAFTHGYPTWVAAALLDALGGDMGELERAIAADRPSTHLLARPSEMSRDELLRVAGEGATAGPFSPYAVHLAGGDPGRIAAVREGRARVQDEGSQLVALALTRAAVEGSDRHWLDSCAGPGGKSSLLAALLPDGASLLANELQVHRAALVRRGLSGTAARVVAADATRPPWRSDFFDRVLADVPCSGLGALRRRPEVRWRRQPEDIERIVPLQRALLDSAASSARAGGLIAYVTCSPHRAETEEVVASVVASRGDLEPIDARPLLHGVPELGSGPTVQLWPHRHGTDAMFLALLRRR
ncbi:MAG TPA: transcription antitermination factor NusB [Mycobacteriales bacterium]|nr:transcription antitermination factor NusB [Mycobacteriales bacterium]